MHEMLQYPLVPGHELAGVVTKVGAKVKDIKVRKRIYRNSQYTFALMLL